MSLIGIAKLKENKSIEEYNNDIDAKRNERKNLTAKDHEKILKR